MPVDVTVSLVTFRNGEEKLNALLRSLEESTVSWNLFVYDNSPTDDLAPLFRGPSISYFHDPRNAGFGRGHNVAFAQVRSQADFHLIVNPDISFGPPVLGHMIAVMERNSDIGILAPKILFPDGSLQRTGRRLPSPMDFFVRRFCPFRSLQKRINERYEIHDYDYTYPLEVPFISGCFMLVRSDLFEKLGGFDERFFMYTEDIDLTRRMMEYGRTVLDPSVSVYHEYERGSHKNIRLLCIFLRSAFQYFNKWGWFFDKGRRRLLPREYRNLLSLENHSS